MAAYRFGGFWRRSLAAILDQIILGFLYAMLFIVGSMTGLSGFRAASDALHPDALLKATGGIMLAYQGFCVLTNLFYFTYFHGVLGRTPGKMALGLKVIQTSGQDMTPGLAFLRWVGYLVSAIFFFLGYLWVAFDPRKQGWHDKIAGTFVIHETEKYLDKEGDI